MRADPNSPYFLNPAMDDSAVFDHLAFRKEKGAALVIVLAFVALVTGLVVAFLSRALLDRQISSSSASQTQVELFAQGALTTILGDLKQEIVLGSSNAGTATYPVYVPKAAANVMPALGYSSGTGGLENLLRVSGSLLAGGTQIHPGIVLSTTAALNGRYVSPARWNKPLLMPPTSGTDLTPNLSGTNFTPPAWVLVSRDGSTPLQWNSSLKTSSTNQTSVVGRYAYAVYNEGGLLDANAAGFPSVASTTAPSGLAKIPSNQTIYKTASSYADLTQIGLSQPQVDQLVGWRNHASADAAGTLGSYSYNGGQTSAKYFTWVNQNPNGFMSAGNAINSDNQTDCLFVSRQQLIRFLQNGLGLSITGSVFQNLSTFSRTLNQPSFSPSPSRPRVSDSNFYIGNTAYQLDDVVNPSFGKVRVKADFQRNDNTPGFKGEPLVKSRFALNRLSWLTCEGPSAGAGAVVRQAYLDHGIPAALLDEGTQPNITKYFGLTWHAGADTNGRGGYWTYDPAGGNVGIIRLLDSSWAPPGPSIADVANMSSPREPNFFELLKAAIHVGSIARGGAWVGSQNLGSDYQANKLDQVDFHILQLGANIIDQFDPDNFPTRIVFSDGSLNNTFIGVEDLPYFYGTTISSVITGTANPSALPGAAPVVGTNLIDSGTMEVLAVPVVWNPHRDNTNAITTALGPTELRVSACNNSLMGTSDNLVYLRYSTAPVQAAKAVRWPNGTLNSAFQLMTMNSAPDVNTGLTFSNVANLYREPTRLMFKGLPGGSNLDVEPGNLLSTYPQNQITEVTLPGGSSGLSYLGFPMVTGSLRWVTGGNIYTVNSLAFSSSIYNCTVEIDYKSGTRWIPYQQRLSMVWGTPTASPKPRWVDNFDSNENVFAWDPRSLRWPMMGDTGDTQPMPMRPLKSTSTASPAADFVLAQSVRGDGSLGVASHRFYFGGVSKDMFISRTSTLTDSNAYVIDADGIVRRPMGAYVPNGTPQGVTSTTVGLPMAPVSTTDSPATAATNSYSRPIVLQRPFRSVAELGYVFSDTPWRNVDFFTPESGFCALLDVFCINQPKTTQALMAGKVDLNTRQLPVLQAILMGTNRDELDINQQYLLTSREAADIAKALVARTSDLTTTGKGPLGNISELVGRHGTGFDNGAVSPTPKAPYDGFSKDLGIYSSVSGGPETLNAAINQVQRFRESALRALSDTGQVGTWNLMIDLVAQVGRYPATATNASQFLVEGEKRYWIHVAIDRRTSQIIDQQIESVNE